MKKDAMTRPRKSFLIIPVILGWAMNAYSQALPTDVTAVPFYDITKPGLSFALDKQSVVGMYEVPGKPEHFLVLGYWGFVWSLYPDMGKTYAPGAMKDYSKKQLADFNNLVRKGWEQGALGAAFDPDFAANRFFYIVYNKYSSPDQYHTGLTSTPAKGDGPGSSGLISVERWKLSEDLATLSRVEDILVADHGTGYGSANLVFGKDGLLYITCDAYSRNSWDSTDFMRKILRIDVSRRDPGKKYAVPPSNPFYNAANPNVKKEIFAFGLRNTYSIVANYLTGSILGAEVGQSAWEEVNILKAGRNYGWADGGDGQKLPNGEAYRAGIGVEGPCSNNTVTGGGLNGTFKDPYAYTGPVSQGQKVTCADFTNGTWNFSHSGAPLYGIPTAVSGLQMNCIIMGPAFRGDPTSPFYGYHFVTDVARNYFVAVKEGVAAATKVGGLPSSLRFTGDVNHNGITSFGEDSYGNLYATMLSSSSTGAFAWHDIYRLSHPALKPLAVPRNQVVPTRIDYHRIGKSGSRGFHGYVMNSSGIAGLKIPEGISKVEIYDLGGKLLVSERVGHSGSQSRHASIRLPEQAATGPLGVRFVR